ncbi:hypothetical protein C8J56DRAFT_1041759 [Mycena floridula]|nr:hypothetical protein C8J56DRAFT_1041759 [Mycena floridula]
MNFSTHSHIDLIQGCHSTPEDVAADRLDRLEDNGGKADRENSSGSDQTVSTTAVDWSTNTGVCQSPETRPYMRVLQAQVQIYVEVEDYVASANTVIEMLRLCPGDNLNQRARLGSVLIHAGRYSDALYSVQSCLDKEVPWPDRTRFREPKYEPLSPETEKSLDWNHGAILYSAALACFKLRGDYLGRKTKPASLNMEARMYNGREDAHDYLWLTQDLWMTDDDDVWSWVQENRDVEELVLKECSRDQCPNQEQKAAQFQRCGSCHTVVYCCRECQKGDWKKHKPDCIAHKERKETINAVTRGKLTSNSANIYMVDMMC